MTIEQQIEAKMAEMAAHDDFVETLPPGTMISYTGGGLVFTGRVLRAVPGTLFQVPWYDVELATKDGQPFEGRGSCAIGKEVICE